MHIAPICTINIHVYDTHIHNQNVHSAQPIYIINIYIDIYYSHIYNQYTCIYHSNTPSIYMYIAPIYTINRHVDSTHIHNQYTRR